MPIPFAKFSFAAATIFSLLLSGLSPAYGQETFATSEVDASVKRGLDWLLDACSEERKFNPSDANNQAKMYTVVFQTAMLLEMQPDLFPDDPRRTQVLKKAELLIKDPDASPVFASWVVGFSSLYAAEKSARSGRPHPELESLAASWIDRQNPEGGWSHGGSGRMIDFYPTTILSAANFALIGLGAIKEFDHEFQRSADFEDVLDDAISMYEKAQSSRGGLPYGARSYQKGVQSARTATSLIGMAALGLTDTELFCKAAHYSVANVETVPFGHASPAMHMGCGALAFAMLGQEYWQAYQHHHFDRVLKIQNEDGSFGDFNPTGPDTMLGGGKVGIAYRTALYLICLTADQSAFIKRLRNKFDSSKTLAEGERLISAEHPIAPTTGNLSLIANKSFPLKKGDRFLQLSMFQNTIHAVVVNGQERELRWVDIASGVNSKTLRLERTLKTGDLFACRQSNIIIGYAPDEKVPEKTTRDGKRIQDDTDNKPTAEPTSSHFEFNCIDIGSNQKLWQQNLPHFQAFQVRNDSVDMVSTQGKTLRRLDLKTGQLTFTTETDAEVTTASVFGFDDGVAFVGGMGQLLKHSPSGDVLWTAKMKGKRGMVQPSAISTVAIDNFVCASTTDGFVFGFDRKTGKRQWKLETDGLVTLHRNQQGQLFAIGDNGLVHAIEIVDSKARIKWTVTAGGGVEVRAGAESKNVDFPCYLVKGKLFVHNRIGKMLHVFDATTGALLSSLPAEKSTYTNNYLATTSKNQVQVFELQ